MNFLIDSLYVLCLSALATMAVLVYRQNAEHLLNRIFVFAAGGLIVWLGTLYVFVRTTTDPWLTVIGRVNLASSLFVASSAYLFFAALIGRPVRAWFVMLPVVPLAIASIFTPWIDRFETVENGQHVTHDGPAFAVYGAALIILLAVPLVRAFAARRRASRRLRAQLAIIGAGTAVSAAVGILTGLVLPYGYAVFTYEEIGALSIIVFLASVWYAISVERLFDLRVVIRRTVVFALLLGFVLACYAGALLLLATALPSGDEGSRWHNAVMVVAILLISFGFDPLRRWIEATTDQFLFRREIERQQSLAKLARRLAAVTALDRALQAVLRSLQETFRPQRAAVLVVERGEHGDLGLRRLALVGFASDAQLLCAELPEILAVARKHAGALTVAGKRADSQGRKSPSSVALARLSELGIGLAMPLRSGTELCGLLLMGPKRSDQSYAEDDRALLEAMASQVVTAIQKARFFESDQTKSEFVSIAAHELVTPIAAVEGYLSMILDEHMGHVDEEAHRYLSKAYPAIQRLASLVRDLLSVSRLEAGRIKIERRAVELPSLVSSVIDQLSPMAREKGLGLSVDHVDDGMPSAWVDPDRLTEVLINLVGNAIKYTNRGRVWLTLHNGPQPSVVTVQIRDTGIGIGPDALNHLFEKFYRVQDPKSGGVGGTGLGLYITKQMVEKMGGDIVVESTPDVGSVFTVQMPSVQPAG